MPFLGNTPAEQYKSIAKQTITGTGATVYSLDYKVTSANDIEVFVNNVRQEPGVAYTASGNSITFTTAVESSDDCYIIFQSRAATSNLIESQNIADGAITTAKLELSDGLTVDTTTLVVDATNNRVGIGTSSPTKTLHIYGNSENNHQIRLENTFGTGADWTLNSYGANGNFYIGNNLDRIVIDSAGRVTMPYQPAFGVYANTETVNAGNPFTPTMANKEFDIGNNFNTTNSRFTAPVDGRYLFTGAIQFGSNGGSHLNFWVNGAEVIDGWTDFGTTTGATQSRILDLNANDYVQMKSYWGGSGTVNTVGNRTKFTGFLIG